MGLLKYEHSNKDVRPFWDDILSKEDLPSGRHTFHERAIFLIIGRGIAKTWKRSHGRGRKRGTDKESNQLGDFSLSAIPHQLHDGPRRDRCSLSGDEKKISVATQGTNAAMSEFEFTIRFVKK
ncbi:hypothetical protein CHS0354_005670 [Potamilus streckersoni]|uniref:Uncharacterized protein n=1 Tax=Potamilus streckersoni TaxID=2493646 RepID=A0AAE0S0C3_9BIVA|nr:hypothetical protein CHS0354_005670 [Potamilus streckersoni]